MLKPKPLYVRITQSLGMDDRADARQIDANKGKLLYNMDISSPGKKYKRLGSTAVLSAIGTVPIMGLCYLKGGGIASRMTLVANKRFYKSTLPLEETGSWTDVPEADIFTAATYPQAMQEAQGSVYMSNGVNSFYGYNGTAMTEYVTAPKGKVMAYFKNRLWVANVNTTPIVTGDVTVFTGAAGSYLKIIVGGSTFDDINLATATSIDEVVTLINAVVGFAAKGIAYKTSAGKLSIYSLTSGSGTITVSDGTSDTQEACEALFSGTTATSTGYSYPDFVYYSDVIDPTTYNMTSNVIKVYSGDGTDVMAMRAFKESVLLIFKEDSIHELLVQGDTATYWNLRPIDTEHGCVAYNCTAAWGNTVFYLSRDGVRIVQANAVAPDLPLSWEIQATWNTINFDYISRSCMIVHNNKLYVAVPTGSSTYPNTVLVYDMTAKGWVVYTGWNVNCWAIHVEKVVAATADEEEILMYGDAANGKVYKLFKSTAYDDTGNTAITYQEDSKRFDFDYPFKKIGDFVDFQILSGTANNVVISGITVNDRVTTTSVLTTASTSGKTGLKGLGRFDDLQLRFSHVGSGTSTEQLIMGEYTIYAKPCGYRRE